MRTRFCLLVGCLILTPEIAMGQVAQPPKPKPHRQFITVSLDRSRTEPLHFQDFPLQQLAGAPLGEIHDGTGDYRTKDGLTTIDVQEFRKDTRGWGVSAYPFGSTGGATLMVRGSYETLPIIRFTITSPSGLESYMLRDGSAYDIGIGVIDADRPAGWGLGVHSFVIGGIGRVHGERGDGTRLFGEGGGGISFGPLGVQIGIKIAYNKLNDPRPHSFYTVPMSLRATVSF